MLCLCPESEPLVRRRGRHAVCDARGVECDVANTACSRQSRNTARLSAVSIIPNRVRGDARKICCTLRRAWCHPERGFKVCAVLFQDTRRRTGVLPRLSRPELFLKTSIILSTSACPPPPCESVLNELSFVPFELLDDFKGAMGSFAQIWHTTADIRCENCLTASQRRYQSCALLTSVQIVV